MIERGPPPEISARRLDLLRGGYLPLPAFGKAPSVLKWPELTAITADQLKLWGKTWPGAINTGILTREVPTLDVDVLNPEASEAVEALVRERFEERGHLMVRIGKPPKRAYLFRTDASFKKITINFVGTDQKIEFLGDGQQVIVDGIHPDTQKPYAWFGGEPWQVKRDDLPLITATEARELTLAVAELLTRDFAYVRTASRSHSNGAATGQRSSADWQQLFDNIHAGQALHDSLRDLAAKMIAAGTTPGAVVNQLRALIQASNTPHDERWQDRYDDIWRLVESARMIMFEDKNDSEGGSNNTFTEDETGTRTGDTGDGPDATDAHTSSIRASAASISFNDFHAYMPKHEYIFAPTGEMWVPASVNSQLPWPPMVKKDGSPVLDSKDKPKFWSPSDWLDNHRAVQQLSWAPGLPAVIKDRLISEGGWFVRKGCRVFNLYKPALPIPVSTELPTLWLDHVKRIYPDDADHIIKWLAHRVQRPDEKLNHTLVLGGNQGIGKDTLLEPVKRAIGPWNFSETSPQKILGKYNPALRAVIMRISEARDLGEFDRFGFYDHTKNFIAAPPDVLRIDDKYIREFSILNVVGVIITTNHKSDGIFLPADDRRHYVAWSELDRSAFEDGYWNAIWAWYANGGLDIVAHYLNTLDLSGFDPKAPPLQTDAFFEIVNSSRTPEDAELADAFDDLGWPEAVTIHQVSMASKSSDFVEFLKDRKNSRKIPHRFEAVGYVPVRNPGAKDGLWVINGRRQVIYGLAKLNSQSRLAAAQHLTM